MAMKGIGKIGKASGKDASDAMVLKGEKALRRKLKALDQKIAARIALQGTRKQMQALAKQMKQDIPGRFKEARKGIGWKATKGRAATRRNGFQAAIAKAGVGVGIKKGRRLNAIFRKIKAQDDKAARGGRPGIGMGKFNFHWWIKGTKSRFTKGGKATGNTGARMPGFAAKSARKARGKMHIAGLREYRKRLLVEVEKLP